MKIFRWNEVFLNGGFLPKAATVRGVAARRQTAAHWLLYFLLAALCRDAATAQGNFTVPFAPTGIAYDASSQTVFVQGGNIVCGYTNGVQRILYIVSNGGTDCASALTNSGCYSLNNGGAQLYVNGTPKLAAGVPSSALALGSELAVGGTNWLMYATADTVYAYNLTSGAATALFAVPAGFTVTGGDWTLRPNGSALADTLIALCSVEQIKIFDGYGNVFQTTNLNALFGDGTDICFASVSPTNNYILIAYDNANGSGYVRSIDFTIPAAEAVSVSAGWTNGLRVVAWSGRWLQGSTNLRDWQTLTNAPQPYPLAATNPAQFFRAAK